MDTGPLRAEEADLEQRLRILNADPGTDPGATAALSARLATVRAAILRATARGALEPLDLDRIASSLAPDEALVGWIEGDVPGGPEVLLAWCLRADGKVRWFRREFGDQDGEGFGERLDDLRRILGAEARSPFASAAGALGPQAAALGDDLFGALLEADALEGIGHLIVVPTQEVELVPLSLLTPGDISASFVPSGSLYVWLRERPTSDGPGSVLAVGDPPFGKVEEESELGNWPAGHRRTELRSLPFSREEVLAVSSTFPEARVLLGEDASEAILAELAAEGDLAGFRAIHLASHALVDGYRPGRSSIALSRVGLGDPLEAALAGERRADGWLTADEIRARWHLNAELVTLSGCRTALGQRTRSEGHLGLTTALLQAGARSLLVSLWDVDDRATMLLMKSFYRHWRSDPDLGLRPKAEALARARRDLRAYSPDGKEHPYDHPAYWSAFVLIGDPR